VSRHAERDDGGEHLIRPFVGGPPAPARPIGQPPGPPAGQPPARPGGAEVPMLRPYLLTAGRVAPTGGPLEIEAQVVASQMGRASYRHLAFEQRDIVLLCHSAMSVAEVAARLECHIGVARVLIADLAAQGHLVVRRPEVEPAQDVAMIERVIRALESIP
jgi:hypothetical protein